MTFSEWRIKRLCKNAEKCCAKYGKMKVIEALDESIGLQNFHHHSLDELIDGNHGHQHHHEHHDDPDAIYEAHHFSRDHAIDITEQPENVKDSHEVTTRYGANDSLIIEVKDDHNK